MAAASFMPSNRSVLRGHCALIPTKFPDTQSLLLQLETIVCGKAALRMCACYFMNESVTREMYVCINESLVLMCTFGKLRAGITWCLLSDTERTNDTDVIYDRTKLENWSSTMSACIELTLCCLPLVQFNPCPNLCQMHLHYINFEILFFCISAVKLWPC